MSIWFGDRSTLQGRSSVAADGHPCAPTSLSPGVRTGTWMLWVSVAEGHAGAADC